MVLTFVFFFGLLNILVGMIMEKVMATVSEISDEKTKEVHIHMAQAARQISHFILAADENGDGKLSVAEVGGNSKNLEIIELLKTLDLPHRFTLQNLLEMFDTRARP